MTNALAYFVPALPTKIPLFRINLSATNTLAYFIPVPAREKSFLTFDDVSIMSIVSLVTFGTLNYIIAVRELDATLETGLKWASLGAACTLVFAVQVN